MEHMEDYVHSTKDVDQSFESWLLSRRALIEKTFGAFVLTAEIIGLVGDILGEVNKLLLTEFLNFVFLVFIYSRLKAEFAKRYVVHSGNARVARILRFPDTSEKTKQEITTLVGNSNTLISQFENINYFILVTAVLYVLLLAKSIMEMLLTKGFIQINKDIIN